MEIATATKLAEIIEQAADQFGQYYDHQFPFTFHECVGQQFWLAFGKYEQSPLMQEVYSVLCDMGMTPLESHQQ